MKPTSLGRHVENFLCGGSAALLLSIAHLRPELWFVSLVALVPFLWRATRLPLGESLALGVFLATAYCYVTMPIVLWATPGVYWVKLLGFSFVFAVYAALVNRLGKHIGMNAVFVALLWLPLEYLLSHQARLGSVFALAETDGTVLVRFASLFGALMVSFVVVLVNSLLLLLLKRVVEVLRAAAAVSAPDAIEAIIPVRRFIFCKPHYYYPNLRAPPTAA